VGFNPKLQKKSLKTPILEVQDHSKSIIDVDTPKKLITNACYHKQDICAYLLLFPCYQ